MLSIKKPIIQIIITTVLSTTSLNPLYASEASNDLSWFHLPEKKQIDNQKRNDVQIVEDFTAHTLAAGEFKLGLNIDIGILDRLMVGTSLLSIVAGAPRLEFKVNVWNSSKHSISTTLAGAYADENTLAIWMDSKKHFDELNAAVFQPGLTWSYSLSPDLQLHTHYRVSIGTLRVDLSEFGKRELWEAKHPGSNYPGDTSNSNEETDNQEEIAASRSSPSLRTLQVQALAGLPQQQFRVVGEFKRESGHRIFVAANATWLKINRLESRIFNIKASHHWIFDNLHLRIGLGVQYQVLDGRDLDNEVLDNENSVIPIPEFEFYFRF